MQRNTPRKRANLRDVAAAAGVSVATVSRVMNAPETVAEATRKKVEEAMNSLHWVPSAAARAINTGRTRFVGALVPTLDNAIFARVLASMESRLAAHRLSLVVATTDNDPAQEAEKAKGLVDIGAEGLIVSGITHAPQFYSLIERCQLPTVSTSFYDPGYRLPTIGYDNAAAARTALTHLTDLGHRRIAVVHGPSASNDRTRSRIAGLEGHSPKPDLSFHEVPLSIAGGCEAGRGILQAEEQPSAVLCLSDVLASGVLFELQREGVAVPQEKSVMGLDDLAASAHLFPALTTVHLPVSRMGTAAADAIASWVETQQAPTPSLLKSKLVVRDSTAFLSAAAKPGTGNRDGSDSDGQSIPGTA
ncbi:substrate-binding domain-containing protein [Leisingera sp. ANG-DT]|uniref:substrate-binding domain-containing protein n=1 Tax=Leisingera sp. ANG-DT TaxID=1577897 RepID=UPI00057E61D0|nr:substrate-binding domain-containing protein [Leisingera sp. ANG-DT]KIC17404.1 LacI family transcriptional regulator [Leisingera sp. ANG-DT]